MLDMNVRLYECGIPILKSTGATWSLEHEFALTLGEQATQFTLDITERQLQSYCLGEQIELTETQISSLPDTSSLKYFNNYIILRYQDKGV